jgi:hypothetical protein
MRDEYDFTQGEMGKSSNRYAEGTTLGSLDSDVAAVLPDSESVNRALRALAEITRQHSATSAAME